MWLHSASKATKDNILSMSADLNVCLCVWVDGGLLLNPFDRTTYRAPYTHTNKCSHATQMLCSKLQLTYMKAPHWNTKLRSVCIEQLMFIFRRRPWHPEGATTRASRSSALRTWLRWFGQNAPGRLPPAAFPFFHTPFLSPIKTVYTKVKSQMLVDVRMGFFFIQVNYY